MVLPLDNMTAAPFASYSVGNGSNPYDMEFHDTTKAYVSRYSISDVAVINPDNGTIISTIIPSDYGCSVSASVSYMCMVQKWNGFSLEESRLFIAVQDGWGSPGKVIVMDTVTDTHLATISLSLQNPNAELDYIDGLLYVSCTGDWSTPATSGIQVIDPWATDGFGNYTYPVSVLATAAGLDVNAVTVHDIEIINRDLGFAVVGKNWGYEFNIVMFDPETGLPIDNLYLTYTTDYVGDLKAYMPGYLFISQTDKNISTGTDFPVYDFRKNGFAGSVSSGSEVVYSLASHREKVIATSSNYNWQNPAAYLNTIELANPAYTDAGSLVAGLVRGPVDISDPGGDKAGYGSESDAIGFSDGSVVSLGDGGYITMSFGEGKVIDNGPGPDFGVYENGYFQNWPPGHAGYFFELAFVEVSSDGVHFARFPAKTTNAVSVTGFDMVYPLDYSGFAGRSLAAVSTNYDLDDLIGFPMVDNGTVDLEFIEYVRIVDVIGNGSTYDKEGNPVYDPYPTAFNSGGFDFDAVEAFTRADTRCHADLDCSTSVDIFDLLIMKNDYNKTECNPDNSTFCCQADIDKDTVVGIFDLLIMKNEYNSTNCPACVAPCSF